MPARATHSVRRLAAALVVAAAAGLARPGPARADLSFIPLPAFETNPNEGETYGVLPVLLVLDDQGAIRRIVAPSVTYNAITGLDGTFRYLFFPPSGQTGQIVAGASTRGARDFVVDYEAARFGRDGRYYAAGTLDVEWDPTARFFGIGPQARKADETNYTSRDSNLLVRTGLNLGPAWRVTITDRLRWFDVRPGGIDTLPFTAQRFPDVPGMDGGFVHAQRLDVTCDTRDETSLPTEGAFAGVGLERSSRALGSDFDLRRAVVDGRLFVPVPRMSRRAVTVLRAALELVGGRDVPFFEQAQLGGENTLRGFGVGRFTDNNSVVVSLEERIRLFTLELFGTRSEWETAPFVEVGKVFRRARDLDLGQLAWSAGVGFRALVRPTVVGRLDIGVGPDGVATFVGLGFPF